MLTHLRLSGLLECLSGLIIGGFQDCGDISAIDKLVMDTLSDFKIPVISGLPAGHGPGNITLPIGLQAILDTDRMSLSLTEPCISDLRDNPILSCQDKGL